MLKKNLSPTAAGLVALMLCSLILLLDKSESPAFSSFGGMISHARNRDTGSGLIHFIPIHYENGPSTKFYWVDDHYQGNLSTTGTDSKVFSNDFEFSKKLDHKNPSQLRAENYTNTYLSSIKDIILRGDKKAQTIWSVPIKENITFIETSFRVIAENKTDNHAGLVWKTGNISYYVFLRPHRLSVYDTVNKEFMTDRDINGRQSDWHKLKIEFMNDTAIAYVDGRESKLQFVAIDNKSSDRSISNIGIRSYNNIAQFDSIRIGVPLNDAVYVYKDGDNAVASHGSRIIYQNMEPTLAFQKAIDYASTTKNKQVTILSGRYEINDRLNFTGNLFLHGGGKNTVLDYSKIGEKDTMLMAPNSRLEDIYLQGSIDSVANNYPQNDFTQRIRAADNTSIQNVWIYNLAYGIDLGGVRSTTISNIECSNLKSRNDWSACVRSTAGTHGVNISSFRITNSNRGIEIEDGASDFIVRDGYMENISNFNNTGHEAFSLDAHSHNGKGGSSNILYQDIYLNHSYAPTTKIASASGEYPIEDLPRNITYENITILNPISLWQVNGDNITIKDSKIINSTAGAFIVYENSRNILLQNLDVHPVNGQRTYIFNPSQATGIHNIMIIGNNITNSADKSGPVVSLHGVDRLTFSDNLINKAPNNVIPIDIFGVSDLFACNNLIRYVNGTNEIWKNPC